MQGREQNVVYQNKPKNPLAEEVIRFCAST